MDLTDWLLDSDPSIRWQVMHDLLEEPAETVAAERARVAREGWGARLLALQDERGYWGGHEYGMHRERTSVTWTLHLLRRLGVDPDAAETRAAIERVRDGVTWREWGNLPYFHGEVEECINGGVLALATYFGVLGEGSDRIVERLLSERLADGGWNCDPIEQTRVSSFDTTLCVLEGLLAYERAVASGGAGGVGGVGGASPTEAEGAIREARHSGEEYLLERRLFKRRSTGEVANERYLSFAFPPYWFYDVLRALDYFREVGGWPDPRLADAIELVHAQRRDDGRWPAGAPRRGEVHFAVDAPEGEPSRWNTLRALRVVRWYEAPSTAR